MFKIVVSNRFKKDLKTIIKRKYDLNLLNEVIDGICLNGTIDAKYKDHNLLGQYSNFRECHIQSDWLLIYRIYDSELFLFRTGTHSDLFN